MNALLWIVALGAVYFFGKRELKYLNDKYDEIYNPDNMYTRR